MTIICQCHMISDKDAKRTIEENAQKLEDMSTKAAASFIFKKLCGPKPRKKDNCATCPSPCRAHFIEILNEEETRRLSAKGYSSRDHYTAAELLSGYLNIPK